ncbi:Uncharacterized protein Fot_18905 [Forsythia ovata]|uniref:Uncharacterized protein n=1 Tax=Forsythia ovata TaxID=205694 RepID=A0ABD1VJK3_9LAMI
MVKQGSNSSLRGKRIRKILHFNRKIDGRKQIGEEDLKKKKEVDLILDLKRHLKLPVKVWSVSTDDASNSLVNLRTTRANVSTSGEIKVNEIQDENDNDVSFTLSLFPDGYSIEKPVENESGHQAAVDVPKFLHPYDRASETLFSVSNAVCRFNLSEPRHIAHLILHLKPVAAYYLLRINAIHAIGST